MLFAGPGRTGIGAGNQNLHTLSEHGNFPGSRKQPEQRRYRRNRLSREDTEEIVSDVFLSLWKNADGIDLQRGTLRGYLAGAAHNQICKRLRSRKPEFSLEELGTDMLEAVQASPSDSLLWDAVAELGEEDAEIFVRFYRYGESLKEIAHAMDFKLSTIKTRLSRGKKKLKQILTDAEELR